MKIAYITYPYFLDSCIERIKHLSTKVDLHVYVIIAPYNLNSTVADFTVEYDKKKMLYELNEITTTKNTDKLNPYFKNCKEVKFVMMPKKSLSLKATRQMSKFKKILKQCSPDIIHLQEPPIIFWSLFWFLRQYPVLMSIHDPQPHTGEHSWRKNFIKKLLFRSVNTFELYSQYSKTQFEEIYNTNAKIFSTELLPYTIYEALEPMPIGLPIEFEKDKVILFYGRISKYKGVEFLLDAFSKLQEKEKNAKLIIAGKSNYNLQIPENCCDSINKNIFILNRYIQTGEVVFLMKNSTVLVCPYVDATQSGIVMTAIPFDIPMIVSNVGALPQQVEKYNCGYVMEDYNVDTLSSLLAKSIYIENRGNKLDYSIEIDETITKILTEYKQLTKYNR